MPYWVVQLIQRSSSKISFRQLIWPIVSGHSVWLQRYTVHQHVPMYYTLHEVKQPVRKHTRFFFIERLWFLTHSVSWMEVDELLSLNTQPTAAFKYTIAVPRSTLLCSSFSTLVAQQIPSPRKFSYVTDNRFEVKVTLSNSFIPCHASRKQLVCRWCQFVIINIDAQQRNDFITELSVMEPPFKSAWVLYIEAITLLSNWHKCENLCEINVAFCIAYQRNIMHVCKSQPNLPAKVTTSQREHDKSRVID
jgi:hypothetical protein